MSPKSPTAQKKYTFPEAVQLMIDGKKVRRLEWENPEEYGLLTEGWLKVFRLGKLYEWMIGDGDALAVDWVEVL